MRRDYWPMANAVSVAEDDAPALATVRQFMDRFDQLIMGSRRTRLLLSLSFAKRNCAAVSPRISTIVKGEARSQKTNPIRGTKTVWPSKASLCSRTGDRTSTQGARQSARRAPLS
jgi:hypothetical protein